jgi:predicted esterase YcpF (UPF0227 family)
MDGIPEILIDDRLVLAGVILPLVQDLAQIDAVVHHLVERLLGQRPPRLGGVALGGEFPNHVGRRATTREILEDAPDQSWPRLH